MSLFRPMTLREYVQQFGRIGSVASQTRRLYWTSAPRSGDVTGIGDACEAEAETFWLAQVRDAVVFNNSIVLDLGARVYLSDCGPPDAFRHPTLLRYFRHRPDGTLEALDEPEMAGHLPAALVVGGDDNHFNALLHWYPRALFAAFVPEADLPITALLPADPRPQHQDLIDVLAARLPIVPRHVASTGFFRVERLYVPSFLGTAFFSEGGIRFLRSLLETAWDLPPLTARERPASRLFVPRRRGAEARRCVHDEAMVGAFLAERYGFETRHFEDMTLREQVEACRAATVLLTPQGAGLVNAMFCQPQTKVVIVEGRARNRMRTALLPFLGMDTYHFQAAEHVDASAAGQPGFAPHDRDLVLEPDALGACLDAVLAAPSLSPGARPVAPMRFEQGGRQVEISFR